jgi:hypothetical protein
MDLGYKLNIRYVDSRVIAFTDDPRFYKTMDELGIWFDEGGRMGRIPPTFYMQTGVLRRVFCRGVIAGQSDFTAETYRSWSIGVETRERAHDLYRMLRSIGVESKINDGRLLIKKWIASVELNTTTLYPKESELTNSRSPKRDIEDFVLAYKKRNRKAQYGLAGLLMSMIDKDPDVAIHPVALRAAWATTNPKADPQVHDNAVITSAMLQDNLAPAKRVEVLTPEHWLEVNGYVVGDSTWLD